jgi:sigma-B regulation protein RsbU (phosphoserine phosphatase)
LSESADKFGSGDFAHRVEVRVADEVGLLASHFNVMAEKIQESLQMEEEKARLKLEMETAQKVQETLFLPSHYKAEGIEIQGFYEAAAECGGDWWYYFKTDDSVWICVGDVTGHGVGPAMLTSSVRSAFSFIEKNPNLTPSQALTLLNRTVCETVNGKLNMTFCLIQICESKSFLRYSTASHEFPLVLKKNVDLKRDEIAYLDDANGPRLGESLDSKYKDKELKIEKGTRIICYSDGIGDVQNTEQKSFGERRFLKGVLKFNLDRKDPSDFVSSLMKEVTIYRDGTMLIDDISLLCVDVG